MFSTAALLLIAQNPAYKIDFADGVFTLSGPQTSDIVRISEPMPSFPRSMDTRTWNLGAYQVTFDKRGVTTKKGNVVASTRLASVATSTMLFSEEQIARNKELAARGERSLEVSGLNGAVVDGQKIYLWLRWDARGGIAWFEGLFLLDTAAAQPSTKFIGKMPGMSFARGMVSDRLVRDGSMLVAPVRAQDGWGVARFDIVRQEPSFEKSAEVADDAFFVPDSKSVFAMRRTSYGTTIDSAGARPSSPIRDILETRGDFVSFQAPSLVAFVQGNTTVLFDGLSGAKYPAAPNSGYRTNKFGVLVWTPKTNPTSAVLWSEQCRQIATWKRQ